MDAKEGFLKGLGVGAIISVSLYVFCIIWACFECTCSFVTCGSHDTADGIWHFIGYIHSWNFIWIFLGVCLVSGIIGAIYGRGQYIQYCEQNGLKTIWQWKKEAKEEREYTNIKNIWSGIYDSIIKQYDYLIIVNPYEKIYYKEKRITDVKLQHKIDGLENSIIASKDKYIESICELSNISKIAQKKESDFYYTVIRNLKEPLEKIKKACQEEKTPN